MAVETIPFSELEKHTSDTFEAIIVMSKRARQINAERLAKMELPAFMDDDEEAPTLEREDLEDIDFDGIEKATTFAIREMLQGDLTFRHKNAEAELTEEEASDSETESADTE